MKLYDGYVFDLDGTLFRGSEAVPGAVAAIHKLRSLGAKIRFATNNSSRPPEAVAETLNAFGFEAVASEVATSSLVAAHHLAEKGVRKAFVVGMEGLFRALTEQGVGATNLGVDFLPTTTTASADAVVVGLCRSFDYALLSAAMNVLRAGKPLIATNADATYPTEGNRLEPGAGALVAAMEACSGTAAEVIGKPKPRMILDLVAEMGLTPAQTLVVGDRLDTDIASGVAAGCPVRLVLTGVTSKSPKSVLFVNSVADLVG